MFLVKAGTTAKLKPSHDAYYTGVLKTITTKKDLIFEKHEMILDPVGKCGCCQNKCVVGGVWERAGWYGFERDGWDLLILAQKVKYLD